MTASLFHDLDWEADIVVLRVHSGVFNNVTWLFSHEEYDPSKYVLEQLGGQVNFGRCGSVEYPVFVVSSGFLEGVESRGGLVVVMGCNGLERNDLGEVLQRDGVGAVVGWSGSVTVEETDMTVLRLLARVLSGADLASAVDNTGLRVFPTDALCFKLG